MRTPSFCSTPLARRARPRYATWHGSAVVDGERRTSAPRTAFFFLFPFSSRASGPAAQHCRLPGAHAHNAQGTFSPVAATHPSEPPGLHCLSNPLVQYFFDYKPGDVHACVADVGWVAGHSCRLRLFFFWWPCHDPFSLFFLLPLDVLPAPFLPPTPKRRRVWPPVQWRNDAAVRVAAKLPRPGALLGHGRAPQGHAVLHGTDGPSPPDEAR